MIPPELIQFLRAEFLLDWQGIHGAPHWARVRLNGLRLARLNGANPEVVELFAFLHDSRRENDGADPQHGERAARLLPELNGRCFTLSRHPLRLLELACRDHSAGYTRADVTVQTCWDADRLDLGRVGIRPDPFYLCTAVARVPEIIEEAYARSLAGW
jgi:uncharacterized protein